MRQTRFQGELHAYNRLKAFEIHESEILRFAKRSILSSKVNQKVSGTCAVLIMPPLATIHIALQNKGADTPHWQRTKRTEAGPLALSV